MSRTGRLTWTGVRGRTGVDALRVLFILQETGS